MTAITEAKTKLKTSSDSIFLYLYHGTIDPNTFGDEYVIFNQDLNPITTGTITQTASSFTQSLSGSVVNSYTGTITQNTQSFTQSASGSVVSPAITGTINQTITAFTQAAIGNIVSSGINGSINHAIEAQFFNDSLHF